MVNLLSLMYWVEKGLISKLHRQKEEKVYTEP
jgi:hypothetical protein